MKELKTLGFTLLCTLISLQTFFSQEKFEYKGESLSVYPHKRSASPAWFIYSAINRKNKANVDFILQEERGLYGLEGDMSMVEMDREFLEEDIFGSLGVKLKPKTIQDIRKNSVRLFRTEVNLHQNITPSIDVLPDGKYVQFYENLFQLDQKGDISPVENQVAGVFSIKNNMLHGFAYWISTAGDTIEQGEYSQGKRVGQWVFNQKSDYGLDEITSALDYDEIVCEYKDGLLDGPYREQFNDTLHYKGFYTDGEPSGEWFFYNQEFVENPLTKLVELKHYLEKHLTYADKDAPVSHKFVIRNLVNQNLIESDSLVMPPNFYQSRFNFNELYKFYKAEVEDLELPEEKITSYDGADYDGTDQIAYNEEMFYDEMEHFRYNYDGNTWFNGKQYSKAKLIDSIGIRYLYKDIYEEFYPNGQLKLRYIFENGQPVWEDTLFWDNGMASNVITYDAGSKEYSMSSYDYRGKVISVSKYDSLGQFVNSPVKYERFPRVMIEGLMTNFHPDYSYYEMNAYDTLLSTNLTAPTTLFKSWYHDKKVCAQSLFNPQSKELNISVNSLTGIPVQEMNYSFGEDYSYFSRRKEHNLKNLKAVTLSNGSYTVSMHEDSLPQSRVYYLREFDITDDYTLHYDDQPFTGNVELSIDNSRPVISIGKNKLKMGLPKESFNKKLYADYRKFMKTGKSKYRKLHPYLDISLSFQNLVGDMFPFVSDLARGVNDDPYSYEDYDIYGEQGPVSYVVRVEGRMVNGKPAGKWIAYDQKGRIRKETNFENGEKHGEERTYAFAYPAPKQRKTKKGEEYYYENYLAEGIKLKTYPEKTTYYLNHILHYNKSLLQGQEKYYDWEGNVNFAVSYKDGYMEGESIERNKLVTTRSSYKDGLLDGIFRTDLTLPDKDTITLFDLNFQNHQLQGESKAYHANGRLAKRGFFLNNEPIDDYEAFDTLGTKYHYIKFLYSFPVEEKIWEENELSVRYLFDWRDSIYFRPDDLVNIPSTYDLLLQYGLLDPYMLEQPYYGRPSLIDKAGIKYHVTKYFPDQVISRDGPIDSGKKAGCWYYNNYGGVKLYEVDYFDTILKINDSIKFKAKGIRTDFDSLGNAIFSSYVIEKIENYDCSHTDHYEVRQFMTIWQKDTSCHRFDGYVKNYYDDGTLQSEGLMADGLPTGVWKYYTPNGQLHQVGEYVQGKRNGRWLKGDLSKTNYLGDICLNPNLPDLEKQLEYQENLLDISIRYFKLGKIINTEYYDINMNGKH